MLVAKTTAAIGKGLHDPPSIEKRWESHLTWIKRRSDMNLVAKMLPILMLTGAMLTGVSGALHAEDVKPARPMKPLEGVLFNVGAKRGVVYFYAEAKRCKLILTVTDEPVTDVVQIFTAVRHEADVEAGSPTRYDLSEGKFIEFACSLDARAMTMKEVERIANGAVK
jgi:hypothetical protein